MSLTFTPNENFKIVYYTDKDRENSDFSLPKNFVDLDGCAVEENYLNEQAEQLVETKGYTFRQALEKAMYNIKKEKLKSDEKEAQIKQYTNDELNRKDKPGQGSLDRQMKIDKMLFDNIDRIPDADKYDAKQIFKIYSNICKIDSTTRPAENIINDLINKKMTLNSLLEC